MAAPPGFDPNASVLPDPGASSAPIHVMRGGGMKGGNPEIYKRWLQMYQLGPGQALANEFSEEDKQTFLAAMNSGGCNWTTKSVLDAKCAPVVNVLKALLKQNIKRVNAAAIPETITTEAKSKGSWFSKLTEGLKIAPSAAAAAKETPAVVKIDSEALSATRVEGEDMDNAASNSIEYNPRNYKGSNSTTLGVLGYNFDKRKMYANVKLGTRRARIRGNSDEELIAAYNAEKGKLNTEAANALAAATAASAEKQAAKNAITEAKRRANAAMTAKKEAERKAYATARARGNKIPLTSRLTGRLSAPAAAAPSKSWNPFKRGGAKTCKGSRKSRRSSRKNRRNTRRGNRK